MNFPNKKGMQCIPFLFPIFIGRFNFLNVGRYLQSAGNSFFGKVVVGDLQDQIPAQGSDFELLKSNA
jgi:hypothetical protein